MTRSQESHFEKYIAEESVFEFWEDYFTNKDKVTKVQKRKKRKVK